MSGSWQNEKTRRLHGHLHCLLLERQHLRASSNNSCFVRAATSFTPPTHPPTHTNTHIRRDEMDVVVLSWASSPNALRNRSLPIVFFIENRRVSSPFRGLSWSFGPAHLYGARGTLDDLQETVGDSRRKLKPTLSEMFIYVYAKCPSACGRKPILYIGMARQLAVQPRAGS